MNKHLHRIVFNKARGALMAVAEIAKSQAGASSDRSSGQRRTVRAGGEYCVTVRTSTFALWAAWGLLAFVAPSTAFAQIVADPAAPASQRPSVIGSANGTPVVNIQTPSAAGVSRNTYSRFDVEQRGVVLNNARNNVQTQLGGWIQGNPWLAGGTARVILNEVNSNNPSLLRGYVEVGGDRAQVVIANPAGVTCDGCGFINANRATLTTGTPVLNGGSLDGYRVRSGTVTITGAGLDASSADYTDIIARAVQVNAGIWAQRLNVVAGMNDVSADVSQVNKVSAAATDTPAFGIDVSELGGMYAGKITLIGTEAGVGVRNAGDIGATAGSVVVQADGRLENSGTLYAQQGVTLNAHGELLNTGTVASQADVSLTADGANLSNTGLLAANGNLDIAAAGLNNVGGQIQAQGAMSVQLGTGTLDNSGSQIMAGGVLNIRADTVKNESTRDGGFGIEGKSITLDTYTLDNVNGGIRADDALTISSHGHIDNTLGMIASAGTLRMQDTEPSAKALTIDNGGGNLYAGQQLSVDSNALGGDGTLDSQGGIDLKLLQDFNHTGQLTAAGSVDLETAGTLTNAGSIRAGGDMSLKATTLENQNGGEISADKVNLAAADTLSNRGLIDGSETHIEAVTANNLGTGRIYGDHIAIAAATLNNLAENGVAPVIAARARLDIGAQNIINAEHALIFSAGDMAIGAALDSDTGYAVGQAATLQNRSATIETLGSLDLSVRQLSNTNEHFSTAIDNTGSDHVVEYLGSGAGKRYASGTPGVYTYDDESLHLHTPDGNYEEWSLYDYNRSVSQTYVDSSDPGEIMSGGAMSINADTVLNDKSHIIAGGAIAGSVGTLTNTEVNGQKITTDSGTVTDYWRSHDKGKDSTGSNVSGYNPAAKIETISLTPTVYKQDTAPTGTGTKIGDRTVITQVTPPSGTGTIMSGGVDLKIPNNSLFSIAPTASYLIETDPRFASYKSWLSSDYMLASLSLDPSAMQKRLGDGFYEQKLIREQVAQLTGRRFLDGYASDEVEYQALMDNGALFAKEHQLVPGVALTAAQMAALTSDIVWLVEQEVKLPDGKTTKALVPQLYVRVQDGDLKASGALIAANSLQLDVAGDLNNSGSIAGRSLLALTAQNINNLGGRMSAKALDVSARNDLNNIGGTLSAEDSLTAAAGHDLNVASTTNTQTSTQGNTTNIGRVAGLYVTGSGGTLVASAGNDLKLAAAVVMNASANNTADSTAAGTTTLLAGHDINLDTVAESASHHIVWDGDNHRSDSSRTDVGTIIQTQGDLALQAGHDLTAKAATVSSTDGSLVASAGNDIAISAGEASVSVDEAHKHKSKGFFSSKTITTRDTLDQDNAIGSSFSAKEIQLSAGNDVTAQGSRVNATGDALIAAGRDVNVLAANNQSNESHFKEIKKSGLMGSFTTGFGIGKFSQDGTQTVDSTTATDSTVSGNNVNIAASRNATITGSNVLADQDLTVVAGQNIVVDSARQRTVSSSESHSSGSSFGLIPSLAGRLTIYSKTSASQNGDGVSDTAASSLLSANGGSLTLIAGDNSTTDATITTRGADLLAAKDISLAADRIELLADRNTTSNQTHAESKSFTVGAQPAGLIGGLAYDIAERLTTPQDDSGSKRLDNALDLKAGYDAYKVIDRSRNYDAATDSIKGDTPTDAAEAARGRGGNPAFGVSISIGSSKSESNSADSSTQVLGSNLQGQNIDLTARKTDIHLEAAKLQADNVTLDAARDVVLEAAANTSSTHSDNKSSSASVGVTFGFGQQNGISFQLGAQNGKGHANGSETTWDNTLITATDSLNVRSGQDATLRGAQLAANQVTMDVGRNLSIETLQDRSNYETEQKSSGWGISLCIPPICYGSSSASVNASNQNVKHNYQSAQGQSGIAAGTGGFDISVGQHTDLIGAAITGDSADNRLVTASLSSRDLTNTQNTDSHADSMALSGSFGISGGIQMPNPVSQAGNNLSSNILGNKALKAGMPASGSEQSQTVSVISPGHIRITGSGDAAQDAQSQATADALQSRDPKTANQSLKNTLTLQQAAELEQQLKKAQADAQAARILAQTGQQMANDIGTLAGKRMDALKQQADAARKAGDNAQADALDAEAKKWDEGGAYRIALHTLAGALTGGVDGALGAGASAAAIPQISEQIKAMGLPKATQDALIALADTAVGAAVGGTAGGSAALNQVANNYLTHNQASQKQKELSSCKTVADCNEVKEKWGQIDKQQTQEALTCLANGKCDSVMMSVDTLKEIRNELRTVCTTFCNVDEQASLNELNSYFLPNGEVNQEALRTGKIDMARLIQSGIGLGGSIAGTVTGGILMISGGAAVLAPEPTGLSKPVGLLTFTTGTATVGDSAYGVYSNAANLYRALQGSLVYLPGSGSSWVAQQAAPNNQTAQDMAQIASLSLALLSGRVYVGTVPAYGGSAYSQYVPATINEMLDANAVAIPGVRSGLLIPTTTPGSSVASTSLDLTQFLSTLGVIYDTLPRLLPTQSKSQ